MFLFQFVFTVTKNEVEVMVSLYQKDVRDQKGLTANREGEATSKEVQGSSENFTIGYHVMKVVHRNRANGSVLVFPFTAL